MKEMPKEIDDGAGINCDECGELVPEDNIFVCDCCESTLCLRCWGIHQRARDLNEAPDTELEAALRRNHELQEQELERKRQ